MRRRPGPTDPPPAESFLPLHRDTFHILVSLAGPFAGFGLAVFDWRTGKRRLPAEAAAQKLAPRRP